MPDFTTSDGLRLHYADRGEGRPILCLSGLTRNATDFDYLAPHLKGVRMIALDYRGRGQSDWADPSTYTVPVEARDAVELLDHLDLDAVPIIGTSRGGIIAMYLAATAKHRLAGVCLNDIGPVIEAAGLDVIKGYVGRNPPMQSHDEIAGIMSSRMVGFSDVPASRWREEAVKHYEATADGLRINYDPALGDVVRAAPPSEPMWPLFEALEGVPLACIRGANSDLLSRETFAEMQARRPDMIAAEVPGRGHIPFLDEYEALDAIARWRTLL